MGFFSSLLTSALGTFVLLPLLLFLLSVKLWALYCLRGRDPACPLPLPPGSMGLPFFGETLQLVLQRRRFLQMKRRKYGYVYKTHLFGRPTVRVMGADNVRQILLGEHRLVAVQWPASVRTILGSGCLSNLHDGQHKHRKKVIMRAFSREALEHYIPAIQEEVSACLRRWLRKEEEEEKEKEEEEEEEEKEEGGSSSSSSSSSLLVYPAVKRLMFRIATRILLGLRPSGAQPQPQPHQEEEEEEEEEEQRLVEAFEEMVRNLFSLPIDVPFSGLYKGLRARGVIHAKIEESIRAKLAAREPSSPSSSSSSSSSSWGSKDALQLLMEHTQGDGEQLSMQELKESATELLFGGHETTASAATSLIIFLGLHPEVLRKVRKELQEKGLLSKQSQEKHLEMEVLEQLKYTGCVVKETLRLSPPVPGGFRVALKTFELNGYQIPKGWNVIYSISDTHEVAELFTNKEEFNPDRFMSPFPEDVSRFSFIPFGGGLRSCVGKEFAKILLKIFTVELARNCDWQLINGPPTMKTGPTVYPEDNLPAKFTSFNGQV